MSLAVSLVICGSGVAVVVGVCLGALGVMMGLSSHALERRALLPLLSGAFMLMLGIAGLAWLYGA